MRAHHAVQDPEQGRLTDPGRSHQVYEPPRLDIEVELREDRILGVTNRNVPQLNRSGTCGNGLRSPLFLSRGTPDSMHERGEHASGCAHFLPPWALRTHLTCFGLRSGTT